MKYYKTLQKHQHEELYDFIEKHRGEIVLDFFETVRLEEIVDGEDDLYYVYRTAKKGIYYSSCVGGPVLLKGQISDEEYERLEGMFLVNCNTVCQECKTYINWRQAGSYNHFCG